MKPLSKVGVVFHDLVPSGAFGLRVVFTEGIVFEYSFVYFGVEGGEE